MTSKPGNHHGTACFFKGQVKDVICDGNKKSLQKLLNVWSFDQPDCKSELEYILLRCAYYDLSPMNLFDQDICDGHYDFLLKKPRRDMCKTCKAVFDNKSCSSSDPRRIPRVIAFGLWKEYQLSLFDETMCGGCRKKLEKKYFDDRLREENGNSFLWLYDGLTNHTPTTISSSPRSIYQLDDELLLRTQDLKNFLRTHGFYGRVQSAVSYDQLKPKSQQNFLHQAKSILLFILRFFESSNFNQIWNDLIEYETQRINQEYKLDGHFGNVMNCLSDAYYNTDHWSTRRQILSIIATDIPFSIIQKFFPDVSQWRIKAARYHTYTCGRGTVVNDQRSIAIRYTEEQIGHFVQYILSPQITVDLPFGKKTMKLSSGDTVIIPNTIRNIIPTRIIEAYKQYCKECDEEFQPLSDTCLFEILNGCSASTRKSLQGLDYFVSDGSNAFDNLEKLCDQLGSYGVPAAKVVQLKQALHYSRNYLKNDYRLHVETSSEVADHCSNFALSDPSNSFWVNECSHDHGLICKDCLLLSNTLNELRSTLERVNIMDDKTRARYLHRYDQHVHHIWNWKAHLMRCVRQDQARLDILEDLQCDSVLVTMDWAMKWLPMKYREAQRDFFAKRGLPWHVTHVIRVQQSAPASASSITSASLSNKRLFQHRTFVHMFDQCTQNARAVTSILADIFKRLKAQDPTIKYAYLRADNAGCFHGTETLLSIKQLFDETGIFIRRIDFSDPQSGKSACDRMAAVVKCTVRRHINEKNNVENSKQFVDAAKTTKYLSAFACQIIPHSASAKAAKSSKKIDWPGISAFNNIQYHLKPMHSRSNEFSKITSDTISNEIEITVWKSYNVGVGKRFNWSDLKTVKDLDRLSVMYEPPQMNDKWMSEGLKEDDDSDTSENDLEEEKNHEERTKQKDTSFKMFDCSDPKCVRQFRRETNLLAHLATGHHKYPRDQLKLLDKAKLSYHDRLESAKIQCAPSLQSFTVIPRTETTSNDLLKKGWALFQRGKNVPFSPMQVAFLTEKYEEGERNGLKWDPSAVEEEMHKAMENGEYLFEPSQCLSTNQIKSFFTRLTQKRRKQSQTSGDTQREHNTSDTMFEEENDDVYQDSFDHAELMRESIEILSQQQHSQSSPSSPSTIRKMNHRSTDDLNIHHRPKRTLSKKH